MKKPQKQNIRQTSKKASAAKTAVVEKRTAPAPETPKAEKKCCGHCPDCQDAMTEAFIKEVDEDVHNDNVKVWWNKYGLYVILFVVLSVCAAVSFETIQNWRLAQSQAKTDQYLSAVQPEAEVQKTLDALEKIAAANNGIYSELARVQIANVLAEQNRMEEAEATLQALLSSDKLSPRLAHLVAIKLAGFRLDTAPRAEIEALLNPVVESNDAWAPLASDLLAMAAVQDGDIETARRIYGELMQNPEVSPNFKTRIQDMLSALNDM